MRQALDLAAAVVQGIVPWAVVQGHVLDVLRTLPDASVHMVVTSPPYWGLRDYGHPLQVWGGEKGCEHEWGEEQVVKGPTQAQGITSQRAGRSNIEEQSQRGNSQGAFCHLCSAWRGALGLEPTPDLYVQHLVEVFQEIRRILRDDGTVWLNLGDSYKSKNLVGIPWRVAFALQADGWYLRSDIIWAKPNPMPESVTDRPTRAHEYLFLLTKSERYYYDAEAIAEPTQRELPPGRSPSTKYSEQSGRHDGGTHLSGGFVTKARRNRRSVWRAEADVWELPTRPFKEAHFAVFPDTLVEPCIQAGTSEQGGCRACGAPWERVEERRSLDGRTAVVSALARQAVDARGEPLVGDQQHVTSPHAKTTGKIREGLVATGFPSGLPRITVGWRPTCGCGQASEPNLVLDPFAGAGTVGVVALRLGRRFLGIDLNPDYVGMAQRRIRKSLQRQAVKRSRL